MNRWKASAIHLALSATIATAVLLLMLALWYPSPFFEAAGGQRVLMILAIVDVVLGPLITCIIFDVRKSRRSLSIDLSVIALLQIAALVYGLSVVFQSRPAFAVFIRDRFELVNAVELSPDDLATARDPRFRSLSWTGPVFIHSQMPTDSKEASAVVEGVLSGKDLQHYPKYYQPYEAGQALAARTARPLSELRQLNPQQGADIDTLVRDLGMPEERIGFLPMRTGLQALSVLVDRQDGRILQVSNLTPW